jgi:hypothetical protein
VTTTNSPALAQLVETLLWSNFGDGDFPRIHPEDLKRLENEYWEFSEEADALLDGAIAAGTLPGWFNPEEHSLMDLFSGKEDSSQLAHDYILTRNRDGCGFWDGDWIALGDELTALAHKLPEIELIEGDDGVVYLC